MIKDRNLKVVLDVTALINHGQDIGAGRYILNLVRSLVSLEKNNEYILYGIYDSSQYLPVAYNLKKEFTDVDISFKFIKAGPGILKAYEFLRFPPIEFFGLKADVVHAMDYVIPPTLNNNIVLTIHDLAFIRFPEFNFEWFVKKYSRMVGKNAVTAKKILASSQSTADDINKYFKIEKDKIETVYLAAEPAFRRLAPNEIDCTILKNLNISKPFLISVGTIEPRKDFATLIKAYDLARTINPDLKHMLIIAGRTGWKSETTYKAREESAYKDDIIFTGRLSDRELIQLYNQADIFVYTSLFEGFGFPPLEAMSCGLPVICSDSSSIKEVVDDAGILVRPGNMEGFAENMVKAVKEKELKKKLAQKSLNRAKAFSWQKTAKTTLSVYRKAAGMG